MDLHMPGTNGIDTTRELVRAPDVAVLVLTMLEGEESVFAALRAGARGYLLKGAGRRRSSAPSGGRRGRGGLQPRRGRARARLVRGAGSAGDAATPFPELTEREREVLDLVARGLTNAEIARRLVVSDKTVRNHVSNVFAKLHVTDRASAVARARDAGLGAPGGSGQ